MKAPFDISALRALAEAHCDLTDPSDPYPAELVGDLARGMLRLIDEIDVARAEAATAIDTLKSRLAEVERLEEAAANAREHHGDPMSAVIFAQIRFAAEHDTANRIAAWMERDADSGRHYKLDGKHQLRVTANEIRRDYWRKEQS